MSTKPAGIVEPEINADRLLQKEIASSRALAWSSFLFAVLQSICGAAVTLNSFRLAIGVGALVFTSGAGAAMVRFHADRIRIPMLALALVGSLINIAILIQVRRLRHRPAAQWRIKPLTGHQLRMERLQWALSLAALVLIGIEEYLHFHLHHIF
jgi:hypothetical protein